MTRDDVLKMEAGREMDAAVAERVMGWKRKHEPPHLVYMDGPEMVPLPGFSTDIAAAWQVVERMRGLGYGAAAIATPSGNLCEIRTAGELTHTVTDLDSICGSICRAALLAVGPGDGE